MISYAQNFEDVMLWRALGHVEHGFYVDIGAQDPVVDSVSLAFHEQGWHGIHVEPTAHYAKLLREQRPGDTVIQAAVGEPPGDLTFFEIPDSGISTLSPEIAAQHREHGYDVHETTTTVVTLASVLEPHQEHDLHWLKIDVEGFEHQVLDSWAACPVRPWIVVVESTLPLTQIENYQEWEPLLVERGYSFVYFDGLNRFYIAEAHQELKQAFSAPPNVFDKFSVNGTGSTSFHDVLKERYETQNAAALKAQAQAHEKERRALKQRHLQREERLAAQLVTLQQQQSQEVAQSTRARSEQEIVLQQLLETVVQDLRVLSQNEANRDHENQRCLAGLLEEIKAMRQALDILRQDKQLNCAAPPEPTLETSVQSAPETRIQQTEGQ